MLDLNEIIYLGSGVALIVALVQVSKAWIKDSKWYPILAMSLGIVINVAVSYKLGIDIFTAVFAGLFAGLTACGVYSAATTKPPES